MALDSVRLNTGSGGKSIASDNDGNSPLTQYQYVKPVFGADGTQTRVTSSVGFPVNIVQNSLNSSTVATTDSPQVYTTSIGLWTGSGYVRAPGDASNGMTVNTEMAAAAALSDAYANPTTAPVGSMGMLWDTSQSPQAWVRAQGDATNGQLVNLGSNNDVTLAASSTGGATPYKNIDVDETEDQVSASACTIYSICAINLTAAVVYLHLYNATAASVTVGTTTPTNTYPVPTLATTNGAGFVLSFPRGMAYGTALTVACTTDVAGTASPVAGPAANGLVLNMTYA